MFLVDKNGNVVNRWASVTTPESIDGDIANIIEMKSSYWANDYVILSSVYLWKFECCYDSLSQLSIPIAR